MSENNKNEPVKDLENGPEVDYTPEQILEMRANMIAYYNNQLEVLKLQHEFEKLKAEISESQLKQLMNEIRSAQLLAGPPKEKSSEDPKKRQLKTD